MGHELASVVILSLAALLLCGYALASWREHRRGRSWSVRRTLSFASGAMLVIAAASPPLAPLAHHDVRAHMIAHVLMGMLGPVGIALGAPVTLALRALPAQDARTIVALLRSPVGVTLGHPITALALSLGGMLVLYTTPLYAAMHVSPLLHTLVHLHFIAAGCLFSWSIAGVDHVGRARPSHRTRCAVLFLAMAAHATLAKSMYARGWPRGTPHALEDIQQAAQIMYYGGDLSELLLALALFVSWPSRANHSRPRRA